MSTAPLASIPVAPLLPIPAPAPAPDARRVSIADRVARAFAPLACVRGFRYFARRRIELCDVTERGLEADVKGKRTQRVRLRVDDGRLGAACSCAAKVLGPASCRHVWATLLEVDRQGVLASLRTSERTLALGPLDAPRPPRAAKANAKASKTDTKTKQESESPPGGATTPKRTRARAKVAP